MEHLLFWCVVGLIIGALPTVLFMVWFIRATSRKREPSPRATLMAMKELYPGLF